MYHFEVGDRVICHSGGRYLERIDGAAGTVIYIKPHSVSDRHGHECGIEFDEPVAYGHNCGGHGTGHGHNAWVFESYLEPVTVEAVEYDIPSLTALL